MLRATRASAFDVANETARVLCEQDDHARSIITVNVPSPTAHSRFYFERQNRDEASSRVVKHDGGDRSHIPSHSIASSRRATRCVLARLICPRHIAAHPRALLFSIGQLDADHMKFCPGASAHS